MSSYTIRAEQTTVDDVNRSVWRCCRSSSRWATARPLARHTLGTIIALQNTA
ncbi:MAG: hypothetical protein R2713_10230 [Ilumatobacteraceae bacterium]